MKTLIADIKRNSLDDGPGIRTVIFFKGCPLSCTWCQNPETKSPFLEISFSMEDCSMCKTCITTCDQGAIDFNNTYRINRSTCNLCGNCIDHCPERALKFEGTEYELDELIKILLKDKTFFKNSGGGITLSGGEPTIHIDYINRLLKNLKNNIHVCLETCGYFDLKRVEELIIPYIDLIYFDLKIYDGAMHKRYCGVSNKLIFYNFEQILKFNTTVEIIPRIPLIPGITSTDENLRQLSRYLKSLNIKTIGLLPYNPLWVAKADKIGMNTEYRYSKWLEKDSKSKIKSFFSDFDFKDF